MTDIEHASGIRSSDSDAIVDPMCGRAGFVQTLHALGAQAPAWHFDSHGFGRGLEDTLPGFLSCSRKTWDEHFGPPQNIVDLTTPLTWHSFQVWEHIGADGNARCLGHLFQHADGEAWVILARVYWIAATSRTGSAERQLVASAPSRSAALALAPADETQPVCEIGVGNMQTSPHGADHEI